MKRNRLCWRATIKEQPAVTADGEMSVVLPINVVDFADGISNNDGILRQYRGKAGE